MDEDGERPVVVFSVAMGPRGEAIELRMEPSRLLYGIDRGAYIEVLKTAELVVAEAEEEGGESETEVEAAKPLEVSWAAAEGGPRTALATTYSGSLDSFRPGLEGFLAAEAVAPEKTDEPGNRLIDSLFATVEQNVASTGWSANSSGRVSRWPASVCWCTSEWTRARPTRPPGASSRGCGCRSGAPGR